ncbi:hypothetical protein [Asticcacaulis sp. W401b]|uniref:hypothetical protein n=1 Tax=Asticcacaulis sp. W401b TaxID=3388666 RepID=UPI003970D9A2
MFKMRNSEMTPMPAGFVALGDAKVETKGDIGEQPDGVQLQQFDTPRVAAE